MPLSRMPPSGNSEYFKVMFALYSACMYICYYLYIYIRICAATALLFSPFESSGHRDLPFAFVCVCVLCRRNEIPLRIETHTCWAASNGLWTVQLLVWCWRLLANQNHVFLCFYSFWIFLPGIFFFSKIKYNICTRMYVYYLNFNKITVLHSFFILTDSNLTTVFSFSLLSLQVRRSTTIFSSDCRLQFNERWIWAKAESAI